MNFDLPYRRRLTAFGALPEDPPAGPAGGGGGGGGAPVPTPPVAPAPLALTQEQLNSLLTRERQSAERAAQRTLLEGLGVESVEALKTTLTAAQAAQDAQKTEAERAIAAAEAAKTAATAATAQAQAMVHTARVERALYAAGLSPVDATGQPNPAVAMATRLVDADATADDAAVAAAVAAVKTSVPVWFTPATTPVPGSVPGAPPAGQGGQGGGTNGGSPLEQGKAIAARLNAQTRPNGLLPAQQAAGQ